MSEKLSETVTLHAGDCLAVMRTMPSDSIDSVCTDPPYHLTSDKKGGTGEASLNLNSPAGRSRISTGFMGKAWDGGDIAFSVELWAEVLRVLKPGGHVAAFGASRGYHRMACAIEDAGFEIRDSLMWVYGTGFPKSLDVAKHIDKTEGVEFESSPASGVGFMGADGPGGYNVTKNKLTRVGESSALAKEWEGWGTALKPAFEPIVLARKPLSEGTVAANVLKWRTGALNIGASRVPSNGDKLGGGMVSMGRPKASEGWDRPWMHDPEVTERKKGEAAAKVAEAEAQGRWPANVVHDGSDEVVGAFPNTASGSWNGKRNTPKTKDVFGEFESRDETPRVGDSGSAARFFYSAKASKADRAGSKHPTVKPISLMEWLALFPGDVVYCWHAGRHASSVQASLESVGFEMVSQIIWAKTRLIISRGDYHWQHEPCWYAVRKGKKHRWSGDRSQTTLWTINHAKSETGHSTQKPIECMRRPILNNSKPGDHVYEPFAGSATTLIACEMEKRFCRAIELSPAYVDVGVKRWQELTGREATLADDGRTFAQITKARAKSGKSQTKPPRN